MLRFSTCDKRAWITYELSYSPSLPPYALLHGRDAGNFGERGSRLPETICRHVYVQYALLQLETTKYTARNELGSARTYEVRL